MIEFSQSELKLLLAIVRSHADDLDNADLPEPEELESIRAKLKSALIKPTLTAELFGLNTQ